MNNIYVLADIHGSYKPIRNLIKNVNKKPETIIILGDAGFNFFFNYRDVKLKEKINSYKIPIFTIRGNHEERPSVCIKKDPNDWHTEMFWNNKVYVENDYPYIKYALDCPTRYDIPIEKEKILKTLVLPGAYSVDKYYRLAHNWSWFPKEQCTEKERLYGTILAQSTNWDLILSHTCPAIYEPTDLFLPMTDQSTVDKTTERWLGEIEYNLNYKLWLFGHYHSLRIYPKYENKQIIMLFNDTFFNLNDYFSNKDVYNCLTII